MTITEILLDAFEQYPEFEWVKRKDTWIVYDALGMVAEGARVEELGGMILKDRPIGYQTVYDIKPTEQYEAGKRVLDALTFFEPEGLKIAARPMDPYLSLGGIIVIYLVNGVEYNQLLDQVHLERTKENDEYLKYIIGKIHQIIVEKSWSD